MSECNVILAARSEYGKDRIALNGNKYYFVKIAEKVIWSADFLILIKSIKDDSKMLVNIECDRDFIVKFNLK